MPLKEYLLKSHEPHSGALPDQSTQSVGSIFEKIDPKSLQDHLIQYIIGQSLSVRHTAFGGGLNANYLFKGNEGLFPHEISELQRLQKEIEESKKKGVRITEDNVEAEILKSPNCIVFPKSGKGRSWFGKMRNIPNEYKKNVSRGGRSSNSINLEDFIVFSIY